MCVSTEELITVQCGAIPSWCETKSVRPCCRPVPINAQFAQAAYEKLRLAIATAQSSFLIVAKYKSILDSTTGGNSPAGHSGLTSSKLYSPLCRIRRVGCLRQGSSRVGCLPLANSRVGYLQQGSSEMGCPPLANSRVGCF